MASTFNRFASASAICGDKDRNSFAGGHGDNSIRISVVAKKNKSRPTKNSVTNGISSTSSVITTDVNAATAEPIR